jgi:putative membrane-bound dehydrogenase-like protein
VISTLRRLGVAAVLASAVAFLTASDFDPKPIEPKSPKDELATFRVPKGFKVELVASEPDVVDPVAIAFDEEGRLFVAEMRGYPNAGVATGDIHTGKVKMLEDTDGDGVYKKAVTYAEGLRFPTAVMPWRGGLIVAVAPEIIYFEDKDGDGKNKTKRTLYTGFDLANIQQLVNSLQWGMDTWIHGCAGGKGGDIRSGEKPDAPVVTLRGRGIRFHPDRPASLEPTSGGGQFGLAADDWQHWFTATNSQHLRQIVLPDEYLRRNPYLPVSAVTVDIPDHGAACQLHRISPFEQWRVERTTRRKGGADSKRFPTTELVAGGFVTSGCSPVVYNADRFPEAYRNCTYICDPANNLIHRDKLVPNGATFVAKRAEADCEFLASTDNWFRPVNLGIGPDGALYVVDFYREVIETPLSLPEDIKKKLNLETRGRGRIWRVIAEGAPKWKKPSLRKAPGAELVKHLENPNPWWRLTAQRLLIERQDKTVKKDLETLARESKSPVGRAHALWTLYGLGQLDDEAVIAALSDRDPGVLGQALRLAEERLASEKIRKPVLNLVSNDEYSVRFQLAFTLGASDTPEASAALAKLIRRDGKDSWIQAAILSSAAKSAPALLEALVTDADYLKTAGAGELAMLTRLAAIIGARPGDAELARALTILGEAKEGGEAWRLAVLEGLGQGMQNSQRSLRALWEQPPAALKDAVGKARPFFERAAVTVRDPKRSEADRLAAARLLAHGPHAVAGPALQPLLTPQYSAELQLAAVRSLSLQDNAKVADTLLEGWNGYSPLVRREVIEALFARKDRLTKLLDAVEQKKILAGQIEMARRDQLRKHPDAVLRKRAGTLLAGQAEPSRQKIIDDYRPALDFKSEAKKGKDVFKRVCSTCHKLENVGTEVGPDLLSALRNKTPEVLIVDILDPSRDVDPRYINYVVTTKAGRSLTGLIAVETPASVTLRRAEKAEDTILRTQIDEITATGKSVMPDELEKQLTKQDLADLIAYLTSVAAPPK